MIFCPSPVECMEDLQRNVSLNKLNIVNQSYGAVSSSSRNDRNQYINRTIEQCGYLEKLCYHMRVGQSNRSFRNGVSVIETLIICTRYWYEN